MFKSSKNSETNPILAMKNRKLEELRRNIDESISTLESGSKIRLADLEERIALNPPLT